MLAELLTTVFAVILGVTIYCKWASEYWKKRNIPCLEELKILTGNAWAIAFGKTNGGVLLKMMYDKIKHRGYKHAGLLSSFVPVYTPIEPEIIKNIIQPAALDHFLGRSLYCNERDDPISENLVFVEGEKWRHTRSHLSPVFTSGKIKTMFDIMLQCAHQMQQALDDDYEKTQVINMLNISQCYTIDVIGACAYGFECNSFKNPHTDFKKYGIGAFYLGSIFQKTKMVLAVAFPKIGKLLGLTLFDRECNKFFIDIVKDAVEFRKNNAVIRKDLLHTLLAMKTGSQADEIHKKTITNDDIKEIASEVFVFFEGGFETSALSLTFSLYELAINSSIQDRLRTEVDEVLLRHGGKISYDAIMEMTYMGQVFSETLRKHTVFPYIFRKCSKDYKIPNTDTIIEKGVYVFISTLGLHHDPDYYPEPEKFDPERFSEENKQKRLPFTYLPFGEGPRMCLAYRFGQMQTRVALTVLLQKYIFSLNKKTEVPIKIDPNHVLLMPKSPIFLDIEKRNRST